MIQTKPLFLDSTAKEVKDAINQLTDTVRTSRTTIRIKGTYETLDALQEAIPSPAQGDIYNVGMEAPYTLWMWDNGAWLSLGQIQGATGANGVTYTPSVEDGVLSWTNNGNLPNPEAADIRGPQGVAGQDGEKGDPGEAGYTPVRGTDYWTEADIAEIKAYVDEAFLNGAW